MTFLLAKYLAKVIELLLDKVELVSVDVVVQQYLHVVMNYPRTLIPFG